MLRLSLHQAQYWSKLKYSNLQCSKETFKNSPAFGPPCSSSSSSSSSSSNYY